MRTSSSESSQDENILLHKKEKPEWLQRLLQRTFFGSCSLHEVTKNELNRYCITCDVSACRHCLASGSHSQHKVLIIYRHVYKDVVPFNDMRKHIDCSKIQAYKCNKSPVIALNPLPHCGSQAGAPGSCDVCNRKLLDPNANRYCSISCKVEAFDRKANDSDPPFLAVKSSPPEGGEEGRQDPMERTTKRRRKRTPQRAPLF